jgi:hypothetical protein
MTDQPKDKTPWYEPTRWGVTDGRVRLALHLAGDDPEHRVASMVSLIEEASRCAKISAFQVARRELSQSGADSQWLEVIEALIDRSRR